jgi:hypothetical protein
VSPGFATALPGLAIDLPEAREGSFFCPKCLLDQLGHLTRGTLTWSFTPPADRKNGTPNAARTVSLNAGAYPSFLR